MFASLFEQARIPSGRAILVHARLRGIKEQSGEQYRRLTDELLSCHLAWAELGDFCRAIDAALATGPWFLVDQPST
jgi:hypothetical protein